MLRARGNVVFDICNYLFVGVLALLCLYPLWDTLMLSLSTPVNAMRLGVRFFTSPITFEAYQVIFSSPILATAYYNSILRTVVGTALTLLVTYCAGYALARIDLPLRKSITAFVLFTMFFNGGLVAIYLNILDLGLMNNRWALILPLTTTAWNLLIARNFLMALPRELEDAAVADGAHPLRIVFSIMFPISTPVLAVLALWTAVMHWNAWFDALLYMREESKVVLQILLRRLTVEEYAIERRPFLLETHGTTTPSIRAGTIIATIGPIILVYPFLQRYFVKGILIGSLKG